ncbi:hypothetical protein Pmani_018374 [Petrolisthes manimaculis]|uniref:THAP-type domain-containing protein n=1 Tax=Petrolisthes manimaculis TaxID=1843537 RepID=A0AAE1PKJ7_9EUCA|nr:hypothetical protein Pmani_018374 [Petrolisthes manimaculis]
MVRCAAYGCKNGDWNIKRNSGITFHRFPNKEKHETRYNKWLRNMRWEKWTPGRRSVICSYHFSDECFDRTGKTVRLRSSAVPTIFDFPSRLCKKLKKRKPPMRRAASSTPTASLDPEPLTREASASPDPSLSTTAVPGPTSPVLSPATTSPSLSTTTTPAPTTAISSTSPVLSPASPSPSLYTTAPPSQTSTTSSTSPVLTSATTSSSVNPSVLRKPLLRTKKASKASKVVLTDHNYNMHPSPRMIKRKLNFLYDNLIDTKRRFKTQVEHCGDLFS